METTREGIKMTPRADSIDKYILNGFSPPSPSSPSPLVLADFVVAGGNSSI